MCDEPLEMQGRRSSPRAPEREQSRALCMFEGSADGTRAVARGAEVCRGETRTSRRTCRLGLSRVPKRGGVWAVLIEKDTAGKVFRDGRVMTLWPLAAGGLWYSEHLVVRSASPSAMCTAHSLCRGKSKETQARGKKQSPKRKERNRHLKPLVSPRRLPQTTVPSYCRPLIPSDTRHRHPTISSCQQ